MPNFVKDNVWAIIISGITLAATFTLYGYRIDALETRTAAQDKSTTKLTQVVNDTNLQTQVSLAKIQTDIEYIKARIDKIVP